MMECVANTQTGSVPVATWAFRATVVQGVQQFYIVLLWFWGARLTVSIDAAGSTTSNIAKSSTLTAIALPIAVVVWVVSAILYLGLPDYYRQAPAQIPSFYRSITSRKIILVSLVLLIVKSI